MNDVKRTNFFVLCLLIYQVTAAMIILGIVTYVLGIFDITLPMGINLLISQFLSFIVPCIYVIKTQGKKISEILPFKNPGLVNILLILGMTFAIQPLMMFVSSVSAYFFGNQVADFVADMLKGENLVSTLVFVAVVPAICEELAFRGIVFFGYRKVKILTAALMNGLFFGLIHLSLQQFFYAFLMGIVFCYFVRGTKSILSSIIAHFALNGTQSVIGYFALKADGLKAAEQSVTIGPITLDPLIAGIIGTFALSVIITPVFACLFYFFYKRNAHNFAPETDENGEVVHEKVLGWKVYTFVVIAVVVAILVQFLPGAR